MKNNEIANATATDITTEITAQGKKLVDKYFNAVDKAKKSAWSVVKVVNDTITAPKFAENFGSLRNYAKAVELSPATISLMNRSYILYAENERLSDFSYTAVAAMLALPENVEIDEFLDKYELTGKTSVSAIKACIEELKAIEDKTESETAAPETAESETADSETAEGETNGEDIEVVDGEVIETISITANEDVLYIGGKLWQLTADDVRAIKEVLGL